MYIQIVSDLIFVNIYQHLSTVCQQKKRVHFHT